MSLEEKLPRMYSCMHIPGRDPSECSMCHADFVSGGTNTLYTPTKPIGGSGSEFTLGSDNISKEFDLGIVDPIADSFSLQERYDFSDHKTPDLGIAPHLNQSVVDLKKLGEYDEPKIKYSGITSKKASNTDGYKGLGEAHSSPLFPQFKPWKDL